MYNKFYLVFRNIVFADVLLRRNPFDEVLSGRNPAGDKVAGEYDVMYQVHIYVVYIYMYVCVYVLQSLGLSLYK